MDRINAIAKKHNLVVIEDAAHSFPSQYKGKSVGTLSDITCFSFYATKTLATGEGGMATTNNEAYAKSMKCNRLHGISKDAWNRYSEKGHWYYEVVDNGYKYNMTDMAASLGLVQLKRADELNKKRADIAKRYIDAFSSVNEVTVLAANNDVLSSWHLFVIKVQNRDHVMAKLQESGVGTSLHLFQFLFIRTIKKDMGSKPKIFLLHKVFMTNLSHFLYFQTWQWTM